MFASRFIHFKREKKRVRARRVDAVAEGVRQVLQTADQKLILMVRG